MFSESFGRIIARDFDGTDDWLDTAQAVVSAVPLSMACWFQTDTLTASVMLMAVNNSANNTNYHALFLSGAVAGDPIAATSRAGAAGAAPAESSAGPINGRWSHACGVWVSDADRRAYFDGGNEGTNTTSKSPTSLSRTSVCRFGGSSPGNYWDGRVAEAAIWKAALTPGEVAALARGLPPWRVRPQSLVTYWPFDGTQVGQELNWFPERSGTGMNLANSGSLLMGAPAALASPRVERARRHLSNAVAVVGRTTKNVHPWTFGVNQGIGIGLPGGSV